MLCSKNALGLGKRLFDDFNAAYSQIAIIREICVISVEEGEKNKSPVHIHDDCIGLEKWCIKFLFLYAYKLLMRDIKFIHLKEKSNLDCLLRCALLLCPDCTTLWNIKKKLLTGLKPLDNPTDYANYLEDLRLAEFSLKLQPKSTEAFAHRKWILNNLFSTPKQVQNEKITRKLIFCNQCCIKKSFLSRELLNEREFDLIRSELRVCTLAASWHVCNYSAWSHRVWVLHRCVISRLNAIPLSQTRSPVQIQRLLRLLVDELNDVSDWAGKHVSDHSCMSYIQFLLLQITLIELQRKCDCGASIIKSYFTISLASFYVNALQNNSDLLELHDGLHEALWAHRRALFVLFYKYLHNTAENDEKSSYHFSLSLEIEFCNRFFTEDSFFQQCIANYTKYLKRCIRE